MIVLLPVTVPNGTYCFDKDNCCKHFDNEGGHAFCELLRVSLKFDNDFYAKKDKLCLQLKEEN